MGGAAPAPAPGNRLHSPRRPQLTLLEHGGEVQLPALAQPVGLHRCDQTAAWHVGALHQSHANLARTPALGQLDQRLHELVAVHAKRGPLGVQTPLYPKLDFEISPAPTSMARRLGLVRRIESLERGEQCLLLGGAQAPNGAADYAGGIVPQELRIAVKDAYRVAQITQAQAASALAAMPSLSRRSAQASASARNCSARSRSAP